MPTLTIGMAHFEDYDGAVFTIQNLRINHDCREVEFVVVDNSPASPHGQALAGFLNNISGHYCAGVKYVPLPQALGTTQSRQTIFDVATGEIVLVMDCHVLPYAGSIRRLVDWFAAHPDCKDLVSGPLAYDAFAGQHQGLMSTHFNYTWRSEMLGTWALAWRCTCDQPLHFSPDRRLGQLVCRRLDAFGSEVAYCHCGRAIPEGIPWEGHEPQLSAAGFVPMGFDPDEPAFEIPAQGLGLFACRKDAWPGFNRHFRGFGGEEWYIHQRFRQAGRRNLCLPFLKWWHRFGRPGGVNYPLDRYAKVRNYVLGHQELALPLDPIYAHFVSLDTRGLALVEHLAEEHGEDRHRLLNLSQAECEAIHRRHKLSQQEWEALLADPVKHVRPPQPPPPPETHRPQPPAHSSIDAIYDFLRQVPRDLDQHLPKLRELAAQCDSVAEFTKRRESTAALLAGRPAKLISHQLENDILLQTLHQAVAAEQEVQAVLAQGGTPARHTHEFTVHLLADSLAADPIGEVDLLYIDTIHHADRVYAELSRHAGQVRQWIVLRGTGAYGYRAEDGQGPGLFYGWARWQAEHPEWKRVYQADHEYGLTVFSRLAHERSIDAGPGTELKAILASLGITPSATCDCEALARQMDQWGPAVCRERKDEIVGRIKANAGRWGWSEKLASVTTAAWKSFTSGLAWQINPLDPIPSLVDLAIRRAEEKEEAA